jgi:glycine/serine hydroxymethyltransferase
MKEQEMVTIADFIQRTVENIRDESVLSKIREEVASFLIAYPLYPEL